MSDDDLIGDAGEFNIATSSLHALSNSMTAGGQAVERHSPHTSPRFTRRSTTPSLFAVQNDLYAAGTLPSLSLASSSNLVAPPTTAAAPSIANNNNNNNNNGINASAAQKSNNRMSAPLIGAAVKHSSSNSNNNNNNNNMSCASSSNNNNSSNNSLTSDNGIIYGQQQQQQQQRSDAKDSNATYAILAKWQDPKNQTSSAYVLTPTINAHSTNISETTYSSSSNSSNSCTTAPPLPPRKSSPGVSEVSLQQSLTNANTNNSNNNGVINKIYGCTTAVSGRSTTPSMSLDNITLDIGVEVPLTTAPPVPISTAITTANNQLNTLDLMTDDMRQLGCITVNTLIPIRSILDEDIEVGPAETIMGVIDTRPLEARQIQPTKMLTAITTTITSTITTTTSISTSTANSISNTIELNFMDYLESTATNSLAVASAASSTPSTPPQQHYTHLCTAISTSSTANSSAIPMASGSSQNNAEQKQLRQQQQQRLQQYYYNQQQQQQQQQQQLLQQQQHHHHQRYHQQQQQQQQQQQTKLLYENVTINQKDCNNVPYENINLEYITRLMSEGYSKENAITALGISRNNIEMACDILREFVSKSSV